MKRVLGAALGAVAGLAFSTMGLVEFNDGLRIISLGGNNATPMVTAAGVAIGALVGATVLWRYPIAIVGATVGLTAGMWLRDNASLGGVQPPWVFFLLFGLPLLGAVAGYLLHLPRTTWLRHPARAASLIGVATTTVVYVAASMIWSSATHDPSCDPIPQPSGSVSVRLCPQTGTPLWIGFAAALLGVAASALTRARLDSPEDPDAETT